MFLKFLTSSAPETLGTLKTVTETYKILLVVGCDHTKLEYRY